MLAILKARKKVLKTKRRDKNIFFAKTLVPNILLLILFFCMGNIPTFNFLLQYDKLLYSIFIILIFLPITYLPSDNYGDDVFLKIMESIELIEEGTKEPELLVKAANKLGDATKRLDFILERDKEKITFLWYSNIYEAEKEFVEKLKYRAIPALKKGNLSLIELESIAHVFIERDIKPLLHVNDFLDKYERIPPAKRRVHTLFIDLIYGDLIPLPIVSITLGELLIFVFIFFYSQALGLNFYDLISDPKVFIPSSLGAMALVHSLLKGRKYAPSIVEIPEDIIVENERTQNERAHLNEREGAVEPTADVDEIHIPEPSFPRDRWEFLWFRYTEARENPWGDFISRSYENEVDFEYNWNEGIVDNSGLSNNVAFKASRTLKLETGRYTFLIGADDGIRLYVYSNDFTNIYVERDEWRDQQWSKFRNIPVDLSAGDYKILIEWYEHYGAARALFNIVKEGSK